MQPGGEDFHLLVFGDIDDAKIGGLICAFFGKYQDFPTAYFHAAKVGRADPVDNHMKV